MGTFGSGAEGAFSVGAEGLSVLEERALVVLEPREHRRCWSIIAVGFVAVGAFSCGHLWYGSIEFYFVKIIDCTRTVDCGEAASSGFTRDCCF